MNRLLCAIAALAFAGVVSLIAAPAAYAQHNKGGGAPAVAPTSATSSTNGTQQVSVDANLVAITPGAGGGGGGTTSTLITAPTMYAPSVVGGNNCAVGASGAASFLGGGFALGATWADPDCERRQLVAMLWNMGNKMGAMELACDHRQTYHAVRRADARLNTLTCTVRPDWEPKGAVTTVAATQPAAPPAPPAPSKPAFNAAAFTNIGDCLNAAGASNDREAYGACSQRFSRPTS